MDYIRGESRDQSLLLPERVEDYVSLENPVRFLDAFVDGLKLEELGFRHAGKRGIRRGRPPYHASDLLKLYLYGYLNRVRSSRRLEAETHRNLELIWLLRKLRPDHKTIAEFRRAHGKALRKVFREFHLLCRKLDLFGRLVAIDGSAIKAVNSNSKTATPERLKKQVEAIDERIAEYVQLLETSDAEEQNQLGSEDPGLAEKLEKLEQKRHECQTELDEMVEAGETHRSRVDPDSRMLKKNGKHLVGYNVQIAVEGRHQLIVAEEVTLAGNDAHQLEPMAKAAAEALCPQQGEPSEDVLQVLADNGYENFEQVVNCEQAGMQLHLPVREDKATREGRFALKDFTYDAQNDEMICPGAQRLSRKSDCVQNKLRYRVYYNSKLCKGCPLLKQCTKGAYRKLKVYEHAETIQRVRARLEQDRSIYERRKGIVEHVFGSMKQWMQQGHFLCKGLDAVQSEFTLSSLAFNMRRVLNVLSVADLVEAVANG